MRPYGLRTAGNKHFLGLDGPGMIEREMIGHKIEDQREAEPIEFHLELQKFFRLPEIRVQLIAVDRIGRTCHIFSFPIRKDQIVGMAKIRFLGGVGAPSRTPGPDAH